MSTLSLSETAQRLGLSAYTLRGLADRGEIPSSRSEGGHRIFKESDVEELMSKGQFLFRPATSIKPFDLSEIKNGVEDVLPKPWKNKRRIECAVVANSKWRFGKEHKYFLVGQNYPEVLGWGSLHIVSHKPEIHFPITEKVDDSPLLKLKVIGECGILDNEETQRWYAAKEEHIDRCYLWSFGHPSIWMTGESLIPDYIFVVLKEGVA